MKNPFALKIWAVTSDGGILQHDIMGVIALGVWVLVGIWFYRNQSRWTHKGPDMLQKTGIDRIFGPIQLWALYFLAVAVTVVFFFIMPRATSHYAQDKPSDNTPVEPQTVP